MQSNSRIPDTASNRLERLRQYLAIDGRNVSLLADAASAAFDAGQLPECDTLLAKHEQLQPLPPSLRNMQGLCALAQGHFEEAERIFLSLSSTIADATVQFNLAYAMAMQCRYGDAERLLSEDVLAELESAVPLKMRCLHHLGQLDDVIALGQRHADGLEHGTEVCGLLATALFDADDFSRAEHYAAQAPQTAGGLTVLGLLALQRDDHDLAAGLFAHALDVEPSSGRAQLGAGLALFSMHDFAGAASRLDRAAALMQTHAGSWLTAGWTYLLQGELAQARERFERALQSDRGFAEASGALAVVAIYEDRLEDGQRHAQAAIRLDPACLSAAYAHSLLRDRAGAHEESKSIHEEMISRPLMKGGPSIVQLIARRASLDLRN